MIKKIERIRGENHMKEIYQERRSVFMKQLQENSIVILYSGQAPMRSMDEEYPFSVDRNFYYFTGIDREHMILFLFNSGKTTMEEMLFIEPYDEFVAKWFGERLKAETATAISGIEKIEKIDTFEGKTSRSDTAKQRMQNTACGVGLMAVSSRTGGYQGASVGHSIAHQVSRSSSR
ncbi:MAG: aminopeptidase P N-terminal domain-containing protein [Lachnospiraceae bacterium]